MADSLLRPTAVNVNTGALTFAGTVDGSNLTAPLGWGYLASGSYYSTAQSLSTSATLGVGTLRLFPWYVPNACTLSRIGAEVTSAGDSGSKLRLGIYADTGSFLPGSLVLDAGTIAGDSATVQEITISQAVTPGLYWIGGAVQVVSVTQPTIRQAGFSYLPNGWLGTSTPAANAAAVGVSQSSVTGALPGTITSPAVAGGGPRVFVKIA